MKLKNLFFLFILFFSLNHIQSTALRIISYNINTEIKWTKKKQNIIKLLKELNADVLCLQEVNDKRIAKELSKKLKMNWHENVYHIGGMTILSKFKILNYKVINIPNSYYNAFLAIKILKNIWICSIHLSSENYKINDTERLRELKFIINNLKKINTNNIIIAGDFNSLENSSIDNLLYLNGYIDTHKNQHPMRGTWMPTNDIERIDRIYIKGNFFILNKKVIDYTDIDWLNKIGWPTGNDHRLVLTDLKFK